MMPLVNMDHMMYLLAVSESDVKAINDKEASYQGSWKKRGGVSVFMMLARKWDRIENQVTNYSGGGVDKYDLFAHLIADQRDEGLLDDMRDLRRYLVLVEAELMARNKIAKNEGTLPSDYSGA